MSQYRQLETMVHSIPGQKGLFLVYHESSFHVAALCFLPTARIVGAGGSEYHSDDSDATDRSSEAAGVQLYREGASVMLISHRHIHHPKRTASASTRSRSPLNTATENAVCVSTHCMRFGEVGKELR